MLQQSILSFALLGAEWILWLLVILSVGIIAVSIERGLTLSKDGSDLKTLKSSIDSFLKSGNIKQLESELAEQSGFEARLLSSGLEMTPNGTESMSKAFDSTTAAEKLRMERGLPFLATVGSNAPFIGLLGTVLGIIQAFHDLAINTAEASEAVMAGISEALVATAVGLIVAIPAVVLYNFFGRWVKRRLARAESLCDLIMAKVVNK